MRVNLRQRQLPVSGHKSLFLEIADRGTRRREALGLLLVGDRIQDKITLDRAKAIRAQRENDMLNQKFGSATDPRPASPLLADYVIQMQRNAGAAMKASMRAALTYFEESVGKNRTLASITRPDLQHFRDDLLGTKDIGPRTCAIYLARIRSIFAAAVRDGIILSSPALGISVKVEETLPTFLTLDELRTIDRTECSHPNIKAGFLFSAFTGLRFSDTTALTWDQIASDGKTMTIRVKKTATPITLPLSGQAQSILNKQRGTGPGLVRLQPKNSVFHLPAISLCNVVLKKLGEAAGIPKNITTHVARHSFATMLLSSGVDVRVIQTLMVHSSLRSTLRYASVIDSAKDEAVRRLPTFDNPEDK